MSSSILANDPALQTHGRALKAMETVCESLGFPVVTYCTAHYLYHKFFATPRNDAESAGILSLFPLEMAMTCVFVAAKMEETVKKTREVAVAFLRAIHGVESQDFDGELLEECRRIMISYEGELLEAIQYQFEIKHPCSFIVKFSKRLAVPQSRAKIAWRLMIMAYRSTLPVYYGPHAVASACIFVAQKLHGKEPANKEETGAFSVFGVSELELLEITAKVLDVLVESDLGFRANLIPTGWSVEEIKTLQIEINRKLRELIARAAHSRQTASVGGVTATRDNQQRDERYRRQHRSRSGERIRGRKFSRSKSPPAFRRRQKSRQRRRDYHRSPSDTDNSSISDSTTESIRRRKRDDSHRKFSPRGRRRDYSPQISQRRRDRSRDDRAYKRKRWHSPSDRRRDRGRSRSR